MPSRASCTSWPFLCKANNNVILPIWSMQKWLHCETLWCWAGEGNTRLLKILQSPIWAIRSSYCRLSSIAPPAWKKVNWSKCRPRKSLSNTCRFMSWARTVYDHVSSGPVHVIKHAHDRYQHERQGEKPQWCYSKAGALPQTKTNATTASEHVQQ